MKPFGHILLVVPDFLFVNAQRNMINIFTVEDRIVQ